MNKIVLIVILVGVLAIVIGCVVDLGVNVYKNNKLEKNTKFPPWPAKCPDYWNVVGDSDNGPTCENVNGIGKCKNAGAGDNRRMNFSDSDFQGRRGEHYKCNWAKKCETPWEGVDSIC